MEHGKIVLADSPTVAAATTGEVVDAQAISTYVSGLIAALGSDDIANESTVAGVTVSDAFDQLGSDDIANESTLAGVTVSAALDGMGSDDVANESTVVGASVTNALETLKTAVSGFGSDDVANDSVVVTGATVTNALETLNTAIGNLGSDDIANESTITGTTVSDALDNIIGQSITNLYETGVQSLSSTSSWTKVSMNNTDVNAETGNLSANTVSERIDIDADGIYVFSFTAGIYMDLVAADSNPDILIGFYVNGTRQHSQQFYLAQNNNDTDYEYVGTAALVIPYDLNTNDYVEWYLYNDQNNNISVRDPRVTAWN